MHKEIKILVLGHIAISSLAVRLFGVSFANWPVRVGVVVFSLLPDLLDKPLYWVGMSNSNGSRCYGHTLAFSILVVVIARFFPRPFRNVALACPLHLLLDRMWLYSESLLWPIDVNSLRLLSAWFYEHGFSYILEIRWAHHQWETICDFGGEVFGFVILATFIKHTWFRRNNFVPKWLFNRLLPAGYLKNFN